MQNMTSFVSYRTKEKLRELAKMKQLSITILDTFGDPIVDFKITVIQAGNIGIYLLAEYSNPNLTYLVGFLD